jgi:DNA-binding GntR family transcriptional regulator
MATALTIAGISFVLFILFARIFTLEERADKRFFLSFVRLSLDNILIDLFTQIKRISLYVGKYIITLSWYYSIHAFLQVVLKCIAGVYYFIEALLHRNRDKARKIRREKKQETRSHLEVIADHKEDNKLSDQQKKQLKDKSLSGK